MNKKAIKAYLARTEQIIGSRTTGEIAHDDAVVKALEQGQTIKAALAAAAVQHPGEAIQWTPETLPDIAAHYAYLKEHAAIMKRIGKQGM